MYAASEDGWMSAGKTMKASAGRITEEEVAVGGEILKDVVVVTAPGLKARPPLRTG